MSKEDKLTVVYKVGVLGYANLNNLTGWLLWASIVGADQSPS